AQVRALRTRLGTLRDRAGQRGGPPAAVIDSLDALAAALEGGPGGPGGGAPPAPACAPPPRPTTPRQVSRARLNGDLVGLYGIVEGADAAPTTQAVAALGELERALAAELERWRELRERVLQLEP